MGQLKWNYTPKMEPSILRILSIRTFSNMRSRSQHSTNLLTGLAPKRPLMASPPELDLLRASLRNSAADVTCFYTKYTSLRREVIKAHTFICIYIIYIYISVIIMSRCICTNICTYFEVYRGTLHTYFGGSMSCCVVFFPQSVQNTSIAQSLGFIHSILTRYLFRGTPSWYVAWFQENLKKSCWL